MLACYHQHLRRTAWLLQHSYMPSCTLQNENNMKQRHRFLHADSTEYIQAQVTYLASGRGTATLGLPSQKPSPVHELFHDVGYPVLGDTTHPAGVKSF